MKLLEKAIMNRTWQTHKIISFADPLHLNLPICCWKEYFFSCMTLSIGRSTNSTVIRQSRMQTQASLRVENILRVTQSQKHSVIKMFGSDLHSCHIPVMTGSDSADRK